MLSKTLIQLSANGWSCASLLLVVWPEVTSLGIHRLYGRANGDLQEGTHQRATPMTAADCAPIPAMSHCKQQETLPHYQVWFSLLWGNSSFPLGPGAHKILFVPFKSGVCFPQSCGSPAVKSHWFSKSDSLGISSLFAGSSGWEA